MKNKTLRIGVPDLKCIFPQLKKEKRNEILFPLFDTVIIEFVEHVKQAIKNDKPVLGITYFPRASRGYPHWLLVKNSFFVTLALESVNGATVKRAHPFLMTGQVTIEKDGAKLLRKAILEYISDQELSRMIMTTRARLIKKFKVINKDLRDFYGI